MFNLWKYKIGLQTVKMEITCNSDCIEGFNQIQNNAGGAKGVQFKQKPKKSKCENQKEHH